MVKLTYIISLTQKSLAFEWIAKYLDKSKFQISFILLNPGDSELEKYLHENNFEVKRITYNGKKDIPRALSATWNFLRKKKPSVVHTHFFDATLIGLTAARLAGVPKRIHTRHHSTFHHEYFPGAIKYDKYSNYLSTDIVAISLLVKNVLLKENVPEKKIHVIHHGFKFDEFTSVSEERIHKIKKQYNPGGQSPVIGVISRHIHLKGIHYIIPAFKKLLTKYPDALLVLANAKGDYQEELSRMLEEIPKKNFIKIPFEDDISALYKIFDVFVHVPINSHTEAFGNIYVEALAASVPSVFTLSGIANDFIIDKENALVVDYKSEEEIYNAILTLLTDTQLVNTLKTKGYTDVLSLFDIKFMINKLETLYLTQ